MPRGPLLWRRGSYVEGIYNLSEENFRQVQWLQGRWGENAVMPNLSHLSILAKLRLAVMDTCLHDAKLEYGEHLQTVNSTTLGPGGKRGGKLSEGFCQSKSLFIWSFTESRLHMHDGKSCFRVLVEKLSVVTHKDICWWKLCAVDSVLFCLASSFPPPFSSSGKCLLGIVFSSLLG